ncbi:hypothetical protein F4806DRAFT_448761 [Annulohypoxylon nitens]|nr:hypothetical protein F4806DRAFT_448761 [Annulohypoxylon nitens]
MAPPTKPSASKGTNPAPDFTVNMNRIQTQLEARMKAVRSFLPSRSNIQTPNPNSAGGSFSALSSSGPQPSSHTSSNPQSLAGASAARRTAAEAEFAEDRNLDPNVGIGVVRATGGTNETNGRDRDTARLRGRLLGKRGKGNEGAEKRWVRKEESSDEEAGRSGLGRKKRSGKRSRTEMEDEDREEEVAETILPEVKAIEEICEKDGQDGDVKGDEENSTPKLIEVEPSAPTTEGNSKKRRKKKKKKPKNKADEA